MISWFPPWSPGTCPSLARRAAPQISTGLSSDITSRERLIWPRVTLFYCHHSTDHLPTSLTRLCVCRPSPLCQGPCPVGSPLDPQHLHRLGHSRCSIPICQVTGRHVLMPLVHLFGVGSVDPDVLFSLVNYCRVIIVRSVSTECINGRKHKRFHALAHRTLEPNTGTRHEPHGSLLEFSRGSFPPGSGA